MVEHLVNVFEHAFIGLTDLLGQFGARVDRTQGIGPCERNVPTRFADGSTISADMISATVGRDLACWARESYRRGDSGLQVDPMPSAPIAQRLVAKTFPGRWP